MTASLPHSREFNERYLRFVFDSSWHVEKYDAHPDYDRVERCVVGTKGVDFVAMRIAPARVVYLIEVKDFREYPINQRQELRTGELVTEIAQKCVTRLADSSEVIAS